LFFFVTGFIMRRTSVISPTSPKTFLRSFSVASLSSPPTKTSNYFRLRCSLASSCSIPCFPICSRTEHKGVVSILPNKVCPVHRHFDEHLRGTLCRRRMQ
jgi:hypothetical protein